MMDRAELNLGDDAMNAADTRLENSSSEAQDKWFRLKDEAADRMARANADAAVMQNLSKQAQDQEFAARHAQRQLEEPGLKVSEMDRRRVAKMFENADRTRTRMRVRSRQETTKLTPEQRLRQNVRDEFNGFLTHGTSIKWTLAEAIVRAIPRWKATTTKRAT